MAAKMNLHCTIPPQSAIHSTISFRSPSIRALETSQKTCQFPVPRCRSVSRAIFVSSASQRFEDYILETQQAIISGAESLDGSSNRFLHDTWERSPGNANAGYGITSVLEGGRLIEKGAVNISIVGGVLTPERASSMSSRGRDIDPKGGQAYSAAALSLVFHSAHPFVPTLRADVRLFEVAGQQWYGGGCDLTPSYLDEHDVREFHSFWKTTCDTYDASVYPQYKEWCDRYFYIPARKECRGVGGIFFDDLDAQDQNFDVAAFVRDVGEGILPSWEPLARRQGSKEFSSDHRDWQLIRRGRYLEFNLLYDRGVKFGLSGGRFESIMVSAPPLVAWRYNVVPEAGSEEDRLMQVLRHPREWV